MVINPWIVTRIKFEIIDRKELHNMQLFIATDVTKY